MRLSLSELPSNRRYALVLCYPRFDLEELKGRIRELRSLGVFSLEFSGPRLVYEAPVLGKGCVGLVVAAYCEEGKAALKVRRTDADRSNLAWEAEVLRSANRIGVGPRLYGATDNVLLMEYVEGSPFPDWVKALKGRGVGKRLLKVLKRALEDCFKLDKAGISHGELSSASGHLIVTSEEVPRIVDFESASLSRKASNVTALAQYFLIGGSLAPRIRRALGFRKREELIETLQRYKRERTEEALQGVFKTFHQND